MLAGAGQAATERSFATIVAPYSGVVSARHVELGEMAVPGKPLMTGFDPATLRVVANVPQAQIAAIQASGKARIEVPALGRWIDVRQVTVVPSADPRTHTTRVRLELPEDVRGVYPGVFARAHFAIGRAPRLLAPRSAVFQRSELTGVYVIDDEGLPRLRQVRLGTAGDESSVEVLAGLKPGERVALEPVKAGMRPRRACHARALTDGHLRAHREVLPGFAAHAARGAGGAAAGPVCRGGHAARGGAADQRHHGQRVRAVPGRVGARTSRRWWPPPPSRCSRR